MVTITDDIITGARQYVPLAQKEAFIAHCSGLCAASVTFADGDLPMYKEQFYTKRRYLLTALCVLYLGIKVETEPDNQWLMTQPEYDRICGSQLLNQLERHKSNPELRPKIFDLLADYRELEKSLNVEVYTLIKLANDPCDRIAKMITSNATPDSLKEDAEALGIALQQLQQYTEGKPNV